eukprot:962466-Amphidinium_carterae.2
MATETKRAATDTFPVGSKCHLSREMSLTVLQGVHVWRGTATCQTWLKAPWALFWTIVFLSCVVFFTAKLVCVRAPQDSTTAPSSARSTSRAKRNVPPRECLASLVARLIMCTKIGGAYSKSKF